MSMKTWVAIQRVGRIHRRTRSFRGRPARKVLSRFERERKNPPNPTNTGTVMVWDTKTKTYKLTTKLMNRPIKELMKKHSKTLENVNKELKARTKHFLMLKDSSNYQLVGSVLGAFFYTFMIVMCLMFARVVGVYIIVGIFGLGVIPAGMFIGLWYYGIKLDERTGSMRDVLEQINSSKIDVTGGGLGTKSELRFSLSNSQYGAYFLVEKAAEGTEGKELGDNGDFKLKGALFDSLEPQQGLSDRLPRGGAGKLPPISKPQKGAHLDLKPAGNGFEMGGNRNQGQKGNRAPVDYNDLKFY